MKTTTILVQGEPEVSDVGSHFDYAWSGCIVDQIKQIQPIQVMVRYWKNVDNKNHPPIAVYLDNCYPLYPTYVYQDQVSMKGLIAVDFGRVINNRE